MPCLYDIEGWRLWSSQQRWDPIWIDRLHARALRVGKSLDQALAEVLPEDRLQEVVSSLESSGLQLETRRDSERDGASKLLFRTRSGQAIETVVLRIASGRTSLCVSSQAGCAVGCGFCSTGLDGLKANLKVSEILDQVRESVVLLATEGRRLRNLVFMGMGEPFHNPEGVFGALDWLTAPKGFGLDPSHVSVSTVGIVPGIQRLVAEHPGVSLALSLHAARQEVRRQIVPFPQAGTVEELRDLLMDLKGRWRGPVLLEYVMLSRVNDQIVDAEALIEFSRGLDVHVNLIPWNRVERLPMWQPSSAETIQSFSGHLKSAGLRVTTRYSLGGDIDAACGQLAARKRQTSSSPR